MKADASSGALALMAAGIPFWMAGVGVLELPIRWARHQPVSSHEAGAVLATYGLAYGLMQVPGGAVTRRLGSVRALELSLGLAGVSWPLSLSHAWWLIAIGRAIYGGAVALAFPAGLQLLRERVAPERLTAATTFFASFWGLGMAMVAIVGSSEALTGAMIGIAVAAGLGLLSRQPPAPRSAASFWPGSAGIREMIARPGVRVLLVVFPGAVFSQQAVFAWGPKVAGGGESSKIVMVGLLLALALSLGTLCGRMLSAVFPDRAVIVACPIVTGLLVIALAFAQRDTSARIPLLTAVVVASVFSWTPGLVGVVRETAAELQPLATSLINEAAWFISSFSPLLLGLFAVGVHGLPSRGAWSAVGAVSICAGVIAFFVSKPGPTAIGIASVTPAHAGIGPESPSVMGHTAYGLKEID